MAFIRTKIRIGKGKNGDLLSYDYFVKNYRDKNGKVKQKVIRYLGKSK